MVKLNFKTKSSLPGKKETPKSDSQEKHQNTPTPETSKRTDEDFDISFSSTESLFPKAESKPEQDFEEEPITQKPPKQKEPDKPVFKEFEEDYYSNKKSGFKIFLVILIVIIIAGAGGYFGYNYFLKNKGKVTRRVSKQTTTQETQTPQVSGVAATLKPIFESNSGTNLFLTEQIENAVAKKPKSADFSLIVITPSEMKLTVLSDSRDSFAQFKVDLAKALPGLQFKTIAIQSKFEDGREAIYADLSAPLSGKKMQAAAISNQQLETPGDFKPTLQGLSQKYKTKIQMYKQGKNIDQGNYSQTLYYINLLGTRDNLLKLLSELGQAVPNVHYNKISIFPYNLNAISDNNLVARINLTYYNPK
jgi:hypothetical protein